MQIRDYEFIHNIEVLFEKKIIIYGAGEYGKRSAQLLEDAGVGFDCFCDKDESNKSCLNHLIVTLEELQEKVKKEECMIIISSTTYCEEMIEELEERGIVAYVCTWYALQAGIELHIKDKRFPAEYQKKYLQRKNLFVNSFPGYVRFMRFMELCKKPHAILIYQPAKVGSNTIFQTLEKAKIETVRLHEIVARTEIEMLDNMYGCLSREYETERVKIITLVREPIGRALSGFMQCFHSAFVLKFEDVNQTLEEQASKLVIDLLDTNDEFLWFDKEIKRVTGVDIYSYPFDEEAGYTWIKKDNIEILVLKLEKLRENVAVLGEFVGKPDIKLVNGNVGSEKHYKYIYEELKKRIKIPARLLDSQYKNNWQMDHFYTEEEKEEFRKKWSEYVLEEA